MNRGIYTLATGLQGIQQAMDVMANNLANSATTGFKQDSIAFADALEREMLANAGDGKSLGTLGSGPIVKLESTDFGQGSITVTQNPLDLAINGNGMFAVQTPRGVRYTRDGSFSVAIINGTSVLANKQGYPVLDAQGNQIRIGRGSIQVAHDGTVTDDTSKQVLGKIALYQGDFRKDRENVYNVEGAAATLVNDPNVRISQGMLENSNANPITSMLEMIKLNRLFELSQKMVQTEDDTTGQLIQAQ